MRINKARKARGVAGGVSGPGVERRHETGCLQGSGMGWSGAQCCAARIAAPIAASGGAPIASAFAVDPTPSASEPESAGRDAAC